VVVFSLGGLSKTVGLPQAKLAWIGVAGPRSAVDEAMSRLEYVCDTYLSVSTPVQIAASDLLSRGATVRAAIQARVARNRQHLTAADLAAHGCTVLEADGGWSAVLQVPSLEPEDALVLRLLTERGLLVHPGYFFDFPRESYLVLSLLVPERDLTDGLSRITQHLVETLETGRPR
jgi:aspartate/methionine/tyrosine aminotransferase